MHLKTFSPGDVAGKKVLVRVDFNVPISNGTVGDTTRIASHLPTIKALMDAGAKIALISHLGRPKGQADQRYSLAPVGKELAAMTGWTVRFVPDCIGAKVSDAVSSWKENEILLLENTRFYPEEEKNDALFAEKLAAGFEVFVMDAFSASHRAHASTRGVADILPSFAGYLVLREIEMLSAARDNPQKPFVLILGSQSIRQDSRCRKHDG